MNYEKKYLEALEKARQFSERPLQEDSSSIVEYIFPELAGSEDERIRKALIRFHKSTIDVDGIKSEDIIAWLKKQGEQKAADKVEPKFKVGDWISGYYTNYKVTAINSKGYVVEDTDGNKINILFENEKFHHLFTIADAKNGDVLCDCHEAYDNPLIFILKKFEHVDFGLVRPSDYSSYCYLTAGDIQRFKEGTYHHEHNIKPATKEQRDLLFQKMKEAGYEWDAEKKKLKKIVAWLEKQGEKPRYSIGDVLCDKLCTTLTKDAQPNFEIVDIRNGMYICDKGSFPVSQQDEYELVAIKRLK